uniref:HNH endonuclease n=1 Tax=Salmonella phage vB_SEnST11_KE23 TaxID=3161174 RepID=A0AAU8GIX4_9CAUD
MKRLVYGVGLNDEENQQVIGRVGGRVVRISTDPLYTRWVGILQRSYSDTWKKKYNSYEGCVVCDEWLVYSKFKQWFLDKSLGKDASGYDIDKDLLFPGVKIYSPLTCCLIPRYLNRCLVRRGSSDLFTGVIPRNNKFAAQIFVGSKKVWLGTFNTKREAHQAWKNAKIKEMKRLQEEYKNDMLHDERVDIALSRCIETLKSEEEVKWIV